MEEKNIILLARLFVGLAIIVISVIMGKDHILWFIGGALCGVPIELIKNLKIKVEEEEEKE